MAFSSYKRNRPKTNKLQNLPVVKEECGLMEYLLKCFPGKSRSSAKSLLAHKQVMVNGKTVSKYDYQLQAGDKVVLNRGVVVEESSLEGVKIIFEDDYIIVIEKAAGLLSVSTNNEKERTAYHMLSSYIKSSSPGNHIFVLHRLDKETSGVMMFAKSKDIQETMQNNWREMVIQRTYTVIVEGKVEKPDGKLSSHLVESKAMKVHTTSQEDKGQLAITFFKLLKQLKEFALLEVTLDTGRKNQIRVHMEEMGNPVVGDKKYGARTNPLQRLGLHASLLVFKHPVTRDILKFESPLPRSFVKLMSSKD